MTMKTLITLITGLALAASIMIATNKLQVDIKKYIIGTWVEEGTSINDKVVFSIDGKCTWYSDGKISDVYSYTLTTGKSQNGKLSFDFLTLTSISNSKIILEYTIQGSRDGVLSLEFKPSPGNLIVFNKVN